MRLPKAELLIVLGLIVVVAIAALLLQVGASGWGSGLPLWADCPHCQSSLGQQTVTRADGRAGYYVCRRCDREFALVRQNDGRLTTQKLGGDR